MIQRFLFSFSEFCDSNFGVVFLLAISAFVFAVYFSYIVFIKKTFINLTDTKKALFSILAFLVFLMILGTTASYDIFPDLEPEILARSFAEDICSGEINDLISKNTNQIIAEDYFDTLVIKWHSNSGQFSKWFDDIELYDDWRSSLRKIDEHYTNIDYYETYDVVYRISPITSPPMEFDLLFNIRLRKMIIHSRFLGPYERWRVTHFNFEKVRNEPY